VSRLEDLVHNPEDAAAGAGSGGTVSISMAHMRKELVPAFAPAGRPD
jgi:hypothetical protein